MLEFLEKLFDTSAFPQRWVCGAWTQSHGLLHIVSDLTIFAAYMAIPIILIYFVTRRDNVPFPRIFWFFGAFILSCGTVHLIEACLFYWPVYRLSGVVKLITALASWATIFALIPILPRALAMKSPEELETEFKDRTHDLEQANRRLEMEIRKREQVESALRESEKRYQRLYDDAPDMFASVNPKTWVVERCNQTLADKLGYSKKEIIGRSVFDLYHPECHEAVRKAATTFSEHGTVHEAELMLRCKNGEKIPVSLNVSPIRDENNEILYSSSTWRDITQRKQAERAVTRLAAIVESSDDAIIGKTLDGVIESWNPGAEQLYGYSREEAVGRHISMLIPETRPDEHNRLINIVKKGRKVTNFETVRVRKDGSEVEISITISPIINNRGEMYGLSAISRNISDRKRAEKKLKKYADQLAHRNKELKDFAYIASHDLKEPLRGIHNYSAFLLEDYADKLDDEGKEKLETLMRLTQRMETLIESVLYNSRVGTIELTRDKTDLNDVVREVLDALKVRIEEEQIEIRIPETLPSVECDPVWVSVVYQNLLANALKYNDKEHKWIEIGFHENAPNHGPVFYVRDNGIGIREKHYDSIFRIFKRLHGRSKFGGGTGAGLTIAKKIIERHGGKIWLESKYGEETTFYFTLEEQT